MKPEDPVCLCFHVSRRKVTNFIRVEKPRRVSQLSECGGAGTGCGWCRPFLERLFVQESEITTPDSTVAAPESDAETASPPTKTASLDSLTLEDYRQARMQYVDDGKGTPPP